MYSTGKIYKIISKNFDKFYIGSTIQTLKNRLNGHCGSYKSYIKEGSALYCSSFDIIKLGDINIELLIDFPCDSKDDLLKKEGELMMMYKDDIVNKNVNKQDRQEYQRNYRDNNKDKIREYRKEYNEKNKDKIREYFKDNKEILKLKRQEKYNAIKEQKNQEKEKFKLSDEYKEIVKNRRDRRNELQRIRRLKF